MKTERLSKIMKDAWVLRKTGLSQSEAQKKAWLNYKLSIIDYPKIGFVGFYTDKAGVIIYYKLVNGIPSFYAVIYKGSINNEIKAKINFNKYEITRTLKHVF